MRTQRRTESGQFDFGRRVLGFTRKVYSKRDAVFREAFLTLADHMQARCPKDTHFLMSSLEASTVGTPEMNRPNPFPSAPKGYFSWDRSQVVGVVQNARVGQKIYLGYTAEYAGFVHDGHGSSQSEPWVALVSQMWVQIVNEAAARIGDRD